MNGRRTKLHRYLFQRSARGERGTWSPLPAGYKAAVVCPCCGLGATLQGKAVRPDGHIAGGLRCAYEGCEFETPNAQLQGWPDAPIR